MLCRKYKPNIKIMPYSLVHLVYKMPDNKEEKYLYEDHDLEFTLRTNKLAIKDKWDNLLSLRSPVNYKDFDSLLDSYIEIFKKLKSNKG